MLFHQFSYDLNFVREFVTQGCKGPLLLVLGGSVHAFQINSTVLEEQLQPLVKQRGTKLVLIAKVGDQYPIDQMTPKGGNILSRR